MTAHVLRHIAHIRHRMSPTPLPGITLGAAGLLALAELSPIARRTALTGSAKLSDIFVLCPGLHRQQRASDLNGGEFPATAAMTTGYVFRVENQATVAYLQGVGATARLVTVHVDKMIPRPWLEVPSVAVASLLYTLTVLLTLASLAIMVMLQDAWGLIVLFVLMLARLLNVTIIRRRALPGWHGAPEPGVNGDLLVLMSQDRWIRIQGAVDALKAVTSGQWLRDMTLFERAMEATAVVLVYLDAIIAPNASQAGSIVLLVLLTVSAVILGLSNELQRSTICMHGHVLRVVKVSEQYTRRLDLAKELIAETGRDDWATRLGMINANAPKGGVTM